MISEEQKRLGEFLIRMFNESVGCHCMASDEEKEELVSVVEGMEMGSVTFDKSDYASIAFRKHTIRADL